MNRKKLFRNLLTIVFFLNIIFSNVSAFNFDTDFIYNVKEGDVFIYDVNKIENVTFMGFPLFSANKTYFEAYNITNNETLTNKAIIDFEYLRNFTEITDLTEDLTDFIKLKDYNLTIDNSSNSLIQTYYIYPIDLDTSDIFIDEFNETLANFTLKESYVDNISFTNINRADNKTFVIDYEDRFAYYNDWENFAINITSGNKIGHQMRINSVNKVNETIEIELSQEIDENGIQINDSSYLNDTLDTDSFEFIEDYDFPNFFDSTLLLLPFFEEEDIYINNKTLEINKNIYTYLFNFSGISNTILPPDDYLITIAQNITIIAEMNPISHIFENLTQITNIMIKINESDYIQGYRKFNSTLVFQSREITPLPIQILETQTNDTLKNILFWTFSILAFSSLAGYLLIRNAEKKCNLPKNKQNIISKRIC